MATGRNSKSYKEENDLEYSVDCYCLGYKKHVFKNSKGPSVCHGVNFVKVVIKNGEPPENLDKLRRLPHTVGLRVIVAFLDKDKEQGNAYKREGVNTGTPSPSTFEWNDISSLIKQSAWQNYKLIQDTWVHLHPIDKSKEICQNAKGLLKNAWNQYMSGNK